MKESKYNVTVQNEEDVLIYNILHRRLIHIPLSLYNTLCKNNEPKNEQISQAFSPFFLPTEYDEQYDRDYLDSCLRYQSTRLNITLMMTMDCNFDCIYCFENKVMGNQKEHMNLDSDLFIEWIINTIKRYSISEVSLCFHGGEPLLEISKIEKIASQLTWFFEQNHIFYLFTMVSNGYFLTEKVVDRLAQAQISIIQITIDGIEEFHDARRKLKNGEGTFNTIITNLQRVDERIKIYVNVVFDSNQLSPIYELIDYLSKIGLSNIINLINFSSTKPSERNGQVINEQKDKSQEARAILSLTKYALDAGLTVPNLLCYQVCTAKQKSSFVILPNGNIYKCISGVGEDYFYLGEMSLQKDPYAMRMKLPVPQDALCRVCKYSPICNQNCYYENHLIGQKICRKSYFDYLLPRYIKLMDEYGTEKMIMNPEITEWKKDYVEKGER